MNSVDRNWPELSAGSYVTRFVNAELADVEHYVTSVYGVRLVDCEMPPPFLSDLDGEQIQIDPAVGPCGRLFLIAHLFGHTVQWNLDPSWAAKSFQPVLEEPVIQMLADYECEAAAYGLTLLHQAGLTQIDFWFSNYSRCDLEYLSNFYRTGFKTPFWSFWRSGAPAVEPKPIPHFTPTRLVWRSEKEKGVVI